MLGPLHKISLRSRLVLLTAVSLLALSIALMSAWRTARMSETFAYRQAEANVSAAAREMLREPREMNRTEREGRKLPPHETEIFARYSDPLERSAAIALHRFSETAGGFCSASGVQIIVATDDLGTASADERKAMEDVCRQLRPGENINARRMTLGNETIVYSVLANDESGNAAAGAFAFRRLPRASGFGDGFNFLTQGFLLLSVVGLVIFSFLTWRDWKSGMRRIEDGLREISGDLAARIDPPGLPELARMSISINALARDLDENIGRQKQLERSLVRNEKLAALGRVVAGVAHEVRNPLASMKLKIQVAERGKLSPEKLEKTFSVLQEEIGRLDNLVKKLLDVSSPVRLDRVRVSLSDLAGQRLSLLAEKAASQNVRVDIDSPGRAEVLADPERLAQVLDNLFRNALEAMPDGGELRVSVEALPDVYRLLISDSGAGFSAGERERLFEPFFTTKDHGTGLGLTISREIIEAHGGKIYLLANAHRGAAFAVELPAE